jgi:bacterioferritin
MQAGALTVGNKIDVNRLIGVLNEIVVTEIVCYLRYSQHAIAATGLDHVQVAAAFEEHADEDHQNGMWAAERVSRLGRDPDFNSATLKECSHIEYVTVDDADLTRILKELGRRTDRDHHL